MVYSAPSNIRGSESFQLQNHVTFTVIHTRETDAGPLPSLCTSPQFCIQILYDCFELVDPETW